MSIYNRLQGGSFEKVRVEVLSKDRTGLVGEICSVITASGSDIRYHRARVFTNSKGEPMSVLVADIIPGGDIDSLLHRLAKIKGAVDVSADPVRSEQ